MSLQRQAWQARAFQWAAAFAQWLQGLPNRLTPPPFRLMQIGSAFWQSRALYVAARLDLATVLADARLTPAELGERVGAHPDALWRLLRMLCAMGVFKLGRDGRVANNALSQPLRTDRRGGVRHMVLMHNSPEMCRPWYETLEQGVRTGEVPFALCHGTPLFDYMDEHPAFDALFAKAMDEVESLGGDSFATAFDWRAFNRLIDVGGNKGGKAASILRRHPHLHAVVVDRPQVVAQARAWWSTQGDPACQGRIEFIEGDVLRGELPAAKGARDAYLLSAVLHGFDDDTCVHILRHLLAAVGTTGAAIVLLEVGVPDHDADLTSASFDMQMFMGTQGRERSPREWSALFERSGAKLLECVALASFGQMWVIGPAPR